MNEAPPRVSVVMPAFNCASTVVPAVNSVLGQTYRDFEFVIIDDGSTDESSVLLRDLASGDQRIRVFTTENCGVGAALHFGICQARGEIIARMDADDLAAPGRFERQVAYLDARPAVVVCGTWTWNFCRELGVFAFSVPSDDDRWLRHSLTTQVCSTYVHSSVMFRRASYFETTGYRFPCAQDYDLWLQLAERGRLGVVPFFGIMYHSNLGSITFSHRSRGPAVKRLALRLSRERAERGREITDANAAIAELAAHQPGRTAREQERFQRYVLGWRLAQMGQRGRGLRNLLATIGPDSLGIRALWRIGQVLAGRVPRTEDALYNLRGSALAGTAWNDSPPWAWAQPYLAELGVTPEVYWANAEYFRSLMAGTAG